MFHANGNQKRVGLPVIPSQKTDEIQKDFKVTGDKEVNYKMIKGSIQQKDITTINIHALNIRSPKYIK